MRQTTFIKSMDRAYRRDQEPESRLLLVQMYWWGALIWMCCCVLVAFVSGAMFLVKAYAQIQNVSTPQVVLHPVFDVGELHTTLQVVLTRGNEIPSKLPQSVDPTR